MQGGFVGPIVLSSTLYFPVLTVNTSSVPTDADATPTYTVYDADMQSTLLSGNVADLSGVTGAYICSVVATAANGFVAGNVYTVLVSYQISAANRTQAFTFIVV